MTMIHAEIPQMFRSIDMNGIIVDCGQRYLDKLRYSRDEVIGTSFFDHTPAKTRKELKASFAAWTKNNKTNVAKKIQLETKYGKIIDVVLTVQNRYENGRIVGRDATMHKVSDIKKLQDAYNVSARGNYEDPNIMRRSVDYIGIIVDCNKTYLDKLGYTRDEVIGISLYEHTAARSRGHLNADIENWRAGHRYESKIYMLRKDGSEFPVDITSADETDSSGQILGRTVSLKQYRPITPSFFLYA